jgi:hypothetical protein
MSEIKNYLGKFKINEKLTNFCVNRPDVNSKKVESSKFGSTILLVSALNPLNYCGFGFKH